MTCRTRRRPATAKSRWQSRSARQRSLPAPARPRRRRPARSGRLWDTTGARAWRLVTGCAASPNSLAHALSTNPRREAPGALSVGPGAPARIRGETASNPSPAHRAHSMSPLQPRAPGTHRVVESQRRRAYIVEAEVMTAASPIETATPSPNGGGLNTNLFPPGESPGVENVFACEANGVRSCATGP